MGQWNRNVDKDNPCYECPDRHTGCHGSCERYKKWRQELDEKNELRNQFLKKGDTISAAAEREMWRNKRYSRQQPIRRASKDGE